jgi:hypothetical protein
MVIVLDDAESSDEKWALVQKLEHVVTVPEGFDPRPVQVAGLQEALKTVRAEAEKKANEIQRKINELLAIEHDSKEPL